MVGSADLLPRAQAAARVAGVTRLAELTRLDRIGLPVWQAVRPLGRALSVHQGKGATDAEAQVGALLEAVECHWAEQFNPEGIFCRFSDLDHAERAPGIEDFARDRKAPPDEAIPCRWVAARELASGGILHVPVACVSLDFTCEVPSPFDRSSNGVATGSSRDEAIASGLYEAIERDSVTEWQARGMLACTEDVVRLDSVPFDWLHDLKGCVARAGASLRCYRVPSITGTPVFACEINDPGKAVAAYRATNGRGCHPLPEIALFRAVAEAIQARATFIAGAREDLQPSRYEPLQDRIEIAFGLPLPPGSRGVSWDEIEAAPLGAAVTIDALGRAGYRQVALVKLAMPEDFHVVRVLVPGLGSMHRRRRLPVR